MNTETQPRSTFSKLRIFLMLPLIFILSGCIRLNMDLKVNNDSTVSGAIVFAVSDLLGDIGSRTSDNGLGAAPLVDQKAKGVTVIPYKESGFTGQKFILDHTPLSALENGQNKDGSLSIVKNNKHIRVSGFLDLTMKDQGTNDPFGSLSAEFAKVLFSSADLRISITVPGKIVKSTGEISNDGKTVTWRPKIGEKTDLATTVDLPSVPWTLIGSGAVLFLALLIAVLVINSQKNRKNQTGEETPLA